MTRAAIVALLAAACLISCAAPQRPIPEEDPTSLRQDWGPLPNAGRMLDRRIDSAEREVAAGRPVDASRLAHMRMTQAAVELLEEGDVERAMDLLERAIAVDGSTGFGYLYLGYLHLEQGRTGQAEVFLDRATALLPSDPALDREIAGLRGGGTTNVRLPRLVQ